VSTTESVALAPVGTWTLDRVHSTVGFEVDYMAGTFKGQFDEVDAKLVVEDGSARLDGVAQVASVDVKDESLTAHLQSPEFFDSERHPELRFVADAVSLDGGTVTVDGEITIKGVTRPVVVTGTATAPIADPWGNERFGVELSTSVDRTEFGLNWNNPLPSGEPALANDVSIVAQLQFVKAA
jgi:polyisoprenoid-binding protein YceI